MLNNRTAEGILQEDGEILFPQCVCVGWEGEYVPIHEVLFSGGLSQEWRQIKMIKNKVLKLLYKLKNKVSKSSWKYIQRI